MGPSDNDYASGYHCITCGVGKTGFEFNQLFSPWIRGLKLMVAVNYKVQIRDPTCVQVLGNVCRDHNGLGLDWIHDMPGPK